MRIAIFEVEDWEKGYLAERLAGHELTFREGRLAADVAAASADAEAALVFIDSRVDADVLAAMPDLRLVVTRSMGYDHVDLAACAARGVTVSRVPAYGDRTVAEHAFALILALSRKVFLAYERTERHQFDYRGLQGFDLCGKTIGIVGGGKIGLNVARIARGFAMDVLVHDPYPRPELAQEIGFAYAPLDALLAASDVITLHCPATPETRHLLNADAFAKMRRGAVVVNTARGSLIDTRALLAALESGRCGGAGLDVLEGECDIKEEKELMAKGYPQRCDIGALVRNHMLIERDDVIITPHIAFNSREAVERILATTVENVLSFDAGKPVNVVAK